MRGHEESAQGEMPEQPTDAIRGEVRLAGHLRVSHGLFLPEIEGLTAEAAFRRELAAWRLVLPAGALFTHLTAARLYSWQLPRLPQSVPVFSASESDRSRPQRPGLLHSRLVRPTSPTLIHGLPVDLPEEILLRAARDLGLLDLLILVDSARRHGHLDRRRLADVVASRRPGVRMLRKALSLSDERADSGPETLLRIFHVVMDVPVTPQARLYDEHGSLVGQADLLVVGTNRLHEYDGEVHRGRQQHRVDLRRDRALSGAGYVRHGYTLDDLLNQPITVMHELDRILGRPHLMSRVRRWQRLVDNSLFSARGRERVLNRWRRLGGIADWSETA
ncbi:MAG: hypothetical protein QM747_16305 [Nocardioides sp.]